MHLVLHARAVPHDLIAPGDETTKLVVGNPDLRQKAAGVKLRQNASIDLVGLDPRMGDIAFTCIGLATITQSTKRESTRTTAMALPVASTTTSSVLFKLRPNPSSPERVMSTRP